MTSPLASARVSVTILANQTQDTVNSLSGEAFDCSDADLLQLDPLVRLPQLIVGLAGKAAEAVLPPVGRPD